MKKWHTLNSRPVFLDQKAPTAHGSSTWFKNKTLTSEREPKACRVSRARVWLFTCSGLRKAPFSVHTATEQGKGTGWARTAAAHKRNSPSLPLRFLPSLLLSLPQHRWWIISLCYLPWSTPWAPVFKHSENLTAWKFLLSIRWGQR